GRLRLRRRGHTRETRHRLRVRRHFAEPFPYPAAASEPLAWLTWRNRAFLLSGSLGTGAVRISSPCTEMKLFAPACFVATLLLALSPLPAQESAKPPVSPAPAPKPAPGEEEVGPHAPQEEPPAATKARSQAVTAPSKGERIVLLGNGLAERDVYYGWFETELHLRFPEHELFVRNMGRPGDTPGFRPHPSRKSQWAFPGAEQFHPDKSIHNGTGFFSTPDQWLTHLQTDTIVAFFGYNESFDGAEGVANFQNELDAFVRHTLSKAYNGKEAPRLVLVSPIAYEDQSQ